MLVSLTARQFDIAGAVTIDVQEDDLGDRKRRATRVATLDGGAVINDFGYTDSDRVMSLRWQPTPAEDGTIDRLLKFHARIAVAVRGGIFEAIIGSYTVRSGTATLVVLPISRLDA